MRHQTSLHVGVCLAYLHFWPGDDFTQVQETFPHTGANFIAHLSKHKLQIAPVLNAARLHCVASIDFRP